MLKNYVVKIQSAINIFPKFFLISIGNQILYIRIKKNAGPWLVDLSYMVIKIFPFSDSFLLELQYDSKILPVPTHRI